MISRPQSTYLVICVVAFSQGVLGLADLAISYMQKEDFKMNPSEMTYVQGIISLPWVVKPLWGLCTDFIPLFGYRRKSYLFIFGILGFCAYNALAIYGTHNPTIGVLLLLSIQTCIAFCNVVGEALLVEESKDKKSTKNVSLFFGIRAFGTLVTSYLSGYCLKILTKTQIFQITSIFPLVISLTSLILIENPTPTKSSQQIKDLKNFINIPEIHQPIMFIFLFMLNPSISTAMFYFNTLQLHYTADFMGQLKFLYALATMWSVWFFNKHLKQVEFKKMFLFSALAYSAVNSLNIILVTRANLKYGIRDEVFSLIDTVLVQTVAELNMLPILVLSCKICPPKIEGTMYALLMSTINLGQLIAKQIGGILMYFLGVNDKNFDNLWILITIASVYVLLPLPFLRIIKEKEMLDIKQKYDVPEMFDDYERISLSFVEK